LKRHQEVFHNSLTNQKNILQQTITSLTKGIEEQQRAFNSSKKELQTFKKSIREFARDLRREQQKVFDESSEELHAFAKSVRETANRLTQGISQVHVEHVAKDINTFNKEIKSLEEVLDDFIKLIEDKITHLKN